MRLRIFYRDGVWCANRKILILAFFVGWTDRPGAEAAWLGNDALSRGLDRPTSPLKKASQFEPRNQGQVLATNDNDVAGAICDKASRKEWPASE